MAIQTNPALGLIKGVAKTASGVVLPNQALIVLIQGRNLPARVYGTPAPNSIISKLGAIKTDANGAYAFYVTPGQSYSISAFAANGDALYFSGDRQAGDGQYEQLSTKKDIVWPNGDVDPLSAYSYIGPWALRPAPAAFIGRRAFITDVGARGATVASNGARWVSLQEVCLPAMYGAFTKLDDDADVGYAWAASLPPGFMGPTGRVVFQPVVTFPNSASTKTIQLLCNNTVQILSKNRTTTTGEAPHCEYANRGDVSSQIAAYNGSGNFGTGLSTVSVATSNVNTDAVPLLFRFQVKFGAAGTGTESIIVHKMNATYYPS